MQTINKTQLLKASPSAVWQALTDRDQMAQWYFSLEEFVPEIGFEFSFLGGPVDGIQYNHLCVVTEVMIESKLCYTWGYEGYEGMSQVCFALSKEGTETRLNFTHEGILSFPSSNPDFAIKNFEGGWDYFINKALPEYLDQGQ